MDEDTTILSYLRNSRWPALAGLIVGAGIVLWHGPGPVWLVAGIALILAVITGVMTARARPDLTSAARTASEAGRAGLPPLAREVFEHLPDPLMLLDANGRVLFANSAMRTVVGVGAENKHVSALLRTPAVLESIDRTSSTGEPSSVEFTVPV